MPHKQQSETKPWHDNCLLLNPQQGNQESAATMELGHDSQSIVNQTKKSSAAAIMSEITEAISNDECPKAPTCFDRPKPHSMIMSPIVDDSASNSTLIAVCLID